MQLTTKQKAELKKLGHELNVTVQVGDKGITPAIIKSLDEALKARELVKISISHPDRAIRKSMIKELADASAATIVHIIGKTALLFKKNPENPRISIKVKF